MARASNCDHNEISIVVQTRPAPEFRGFTFSRFRSLLTDGHENTQTDHLVVGAVYEDEPVGLALFSRPYGDAVRRLLSVFVARRFRQKGIGFGLLAKGEQSALEAGTQKLVAFHSNQMKNMEIYESLMQKAGWSSPALYEFRAGSKVQWVYQAEQDWAKFLARMVRGGFCTTTWQDLTESDREQIANVVAHEMPESDRGFDPLKQKLPDFLPELSVFLRCDQKIVGWILGSKSGQENTYYYTHGYVLPQYQKRGYLIMGMVAVCRRQADLFGPETISAYETSVMGMHRVMQRMMPYTDWADERFVCEKILAG